MTSSRNRLVVRPGHRFASRTRLRRRPALGSALLLSSIGALALVFLLAIGIVGALWRRNLG